MKEFEKEMDYGFLSSQLEQADSLQEKGLYNEAYELYGSVRMMLMSELYRTQNTRKIAKGAGWLAAVATGGFGLEDLFIVPAVNKLAEKFTGTNLEATLGFLYYIISQRLFLIGISREIDRTKDVNKILMDFLIAYRILRSRIQRTDSSELMKLINPFVDSSPITGGELVFSYEQLVSELCNEVQSTLSDVQYLNNHLYLYLNEQRLYNSELFNVLKRQRTSFESYYSSYQGTQQEQIPEKDPDKYYGEIFGLTGKVTKSYIRRRYRELMKLYHPDIIVNGTAQQKKEFEQKAKLINEAMAYFKLNYNL